MLVKLCSIPYLDNSYQNVIDFETNQQRYDFLESRVLKTVEVNLQYDAEQTYIIVPLEVQDCRRYDYLFYVDSKGKGWYYFINNIQFETKKTTRFIIELDIWMSYMFTFTILPSFVDRCHVNRWDDVNFPSSNNIDEGLDYGDIVQLYRAEEICKFNDSIVITSTVPLGKLETSNTGEGGGENNGNCWENGNASSKGFRFLKGFEGFAPREYQDSGGYWTIGYGTTKHGEKDIYEQLVAKQPITETEGAKVAYELLQKRYGLPILDSVKALGCSNQSQFDALLSVAYNSGIGSITNSNSLTQAILKNPNDESTIRPIWEKFKITSNGVPLEGLRLRRIQECNMYFGKDVEIRPIGLINTSGNVSGTMQENNGDGWLPSECGDNNNSTGDYNGYKSFNNEFGKDWLCPVKGGQVTSKYGWRINPITNEKGEFHNGTDIGVPLNTDYIASKDGVVSQQGYSNSMGNYIYIDHEGGYRTRVMHLNKILTKEGQKVKRGEIIGKAGTTGSSTGVHAHWEIRRISDNKSTDPAPTLKVGEKV